MKWKKYTIYTTTEAEDLISSMLNDLGVEGVQIEDNVPLTEEDTKGMFIDILPELPPDDGTSRVSFFLREAEDEAAADTCAERAAENTGEKKTGSANSTMRADDPSVDNSYTANDRLWTAKEIEALLADVMRELEAMRAYAEIGEGRIEIGETQDTDWMNNWKQFFKPFLVEDFLVKPTWEEVPAEHEAALKNGSLHLLEIDPGTAFGTGTHETTQLCMKMLKKYIRGGERVLDIGTGSGILGIAALKLGAESVFATELDEACRESIADNLRANGISEEIFRLVIGNLIGDEALCAEAGFGCYDVIVANILAPVIVLLAAEGAADRHAKPGAIFITSGIIDTREAEVLAAFRENPNWEILEVNHQGEWCNVTARRV